MMTMTNSTAAHTPHRHPINKTTSSRPFSTPKTSTASKLGLRCNHDASSTTPVVLREIPTRISLPDPSCAVINHADNEEHHSNQHSPPNPDEGSPPLSAPSPQGCDINDEEFDYAAELDAITEACERMQQRWPTATTMATPNHSPTATTHWYDDDDDDGDHPLALDALVEECERLQHRWQPVTSAAAPTPLPMNRTPLNNLLRPIFAPSPTLKSLSLKPWMIATIDPKNPMVTNCRGVFMTYLCSRHASWRNLLS